MLAHSMMKYLCLDMYLMAAVCESTLMYREFKGRSCGKGEYYNSSNEGCLPCPENTFNQLQAHQLPHCSPCRDVRGELQILLRNCTSTSDAVVGCKTGFRASFSENASVDIVCRPCNRCDQSKDTGCVKDAATLCIESFQKVIILCIILPVGLVLVALLFYLRHNQVLYDSGQCMRPYYYYRRNSSQILNEV